MNSSEIIETFLNGRVSVVTGNITHQRVDAIVNAANATLLGGGGVDGAIHEAGGPQILAECQEIRRVRHPKGLPTGEAVITTGGQLPARYVIHTVGPIKGIDVGREAAQLAACYGNSLALAVEHGLRTVAFPSISTGAYGYPRDEAGRISSEAIRSFLSGDGTLEEVRLVFFAPSDARMFLKHQQFAGIFRGQVEG